jgi:hypothetical protein
MANYISFTRDGYYSIGRIVGTTIKVPMPIPRTMTAIHDEGCVIQSYHDRS